MKRCEFQKDVERWFDGELTESDAVEQHLAGCSLCAAHFEGFKNLRDGVQAVRERVEITDAQLPGFLEGIEDQVHRPRGKRVALWAMASTVAAAIVVAVALMVTFPSGQGPIEATVFEEVSTDIDGATAESFYLENGTATVWINLPDGEML